MIHNRTKETHASDGSLTVSEAERRHEQWRDEQPVTTSCARCPWKFSGAAADARVAFKEHLAAEHPNLVPRRRRRRSKNEERADAMVAVAGRRSVAGVINGDGAT